MSLGVRLPDEADKWTVRRWRNSDRIRRVSTNDRPIPKEEHSVWYDRLIADRQAQVSIVTFNERPVGVVQLETVNTVQSTASWGCYLGETDVHPAVGACLPLLGLSLGFDAWGLHRLFGDVLSINNNMLRVHKRLGVPNEGIRREHVKRETGERVDVHEFGMLRTEWPLVRDRSQKLLPSSIREDMKSIYQSLSVANFGPE